MVIIFSLFEPKIKAVQDADGEHDCASNQEAPQALCKASEDVSKPSKKAGESNDVPMLSLLKFLGISPVVPASDKLLEVIKRLAAHPEPTI